MTNRIRIARFGKVTLFVVTVLTMSSIQCGDEKTSGNDTIRPKVLVRKNVNSLRPAEITSLRKGVAAMKARDVSDPTSWWYQANIHGTTQVPEEPSWNQCKHRSYQFLGWHRLYLYYFERILRDAANDPNLTLPYWNYSDTSSADNRAIPLPYRKPADAGNALFEAKRGMGWNQGARLPTSAVDTARAFSRLKFLSGPSQSADKSFGGGDPRGLGQLERTPHNVIHTAIGRLMGNPRFAAQDPIFWAHHCNIDRLWESWLALGKGQANPTDASFVDQQYTFFDERGNSVTRRVGDFLDTVALGYQYQSLETTSDSAAPAPQASPERDKKVEESNPRILSQSSTMTLHGKTHSVTMPSWISREEEDAQVLTVEELDFEEPPVGYYEVYINLPEGEEPDHKSKYFIGNLSFFGFGPQAHGDHKPVHAYDISEAIKKLKESGEWRDRQNLKITFVKRSPELPPGLPPSLMPREDEDPPVKIGKITISAR